LAWQPVVKMMREDGNLAVAGMWLVAGSQEGNRIEMTGTNRKGRNCVKLTLSTRRLYKVFPPSPCLAGLYAAMNLVRISSFLENSERTLGKGISNGKRKSKKKYKRSSRHASTSRKMTRQSYAVCVTSHHVSSGSSFKLRACFRVSGNVGTHYSGPVYYYDARVRAH